MPRTIKLMTTLPLIALLAACQTSGQVDTPAEIEATLDQDIDGDGSVIQSGVEVGTEG